MAWTPQKMPRCLGTGDFVLLELGRRVGGGEAWQVFGDLDTGETFRVGGFTLQNDKVWPRCPPPKQWEVCFGVVIPVFFFGGSS